MGFTHVFSDGFYTSDNVDWNDVWTGSLTPSRQMYNEEEALDFRALLTSDTDDTLVNINIPNTDRFDKLGEISKADAKQITRGKWHGVTDKFGGAYGYTYDSLKDMKLSDIEDTQAKMFDMDRKTMRFEIIKAIMLDNGSTAQCLWNGYFDSLENIAVPPPQGANEFVAGHDHYIVSGATTFTDLTLITTAASHIREHGYEGRIACFINIAQDKEIADHLLATSTSVQVSNPITNIMGADGIDWMGRLVGVDFIRTSSMPAGYCLFAGVDVTGGTTVAKFIESHNSSFRGLILVRGSNPDYPIIESYYMRYFGSRVFNRSLGVACQLKESGSYSNPSYYDV